MCLATTKNFVGVTRDRLGVVGGPSSIGIEAGVYVASGLEGSTFPVSYAALGLPNQSNTNYVVIVTGGAGANTLTTYVTIGYLTTGFTLAMGIAPAAGDLINFLVVPR